MKPSHAEALSEANTQAFWVTAAYVVSEPTQLISLIATRLRREVPSECKEAHIDAMRRGAPICTEGTFMKLVTDGITTQSYTQIKYKSMKM